MNPWIDVIGWTLIHFVWQGGVLTGATVLILWLCRRRSAEARYAVACFCLIAMLASALATAVRLRASDPWLPAGESVLTEAPDSGPAPAQPGNAGKGVSTAGSADHGVLTVDAVLPAVVWIWLAGAAALLVRFSGGCWRVHRLRRATLAIERSPWQSVSERLAHRLRVRVAFHVVESSLVDVPAVLGWMRPIVLLPVAVLAAIPPDQIEALIAHELAHIRRRDYAVNLLQTIAEALLFFHPGVWWVSARIRQEREHCCDDAAVAVCGEATAYAEALATVAAGRLRGAALSIGAADGSLLGRIHRLVDLPREEQPHAFSGLVVVALGLALVAGTMVLSRPASAEAQTPAGAAQASGIRKTDHFEIHYAPALDLHADRIAAEAERAYERVSGDLRHNLAFTVPLILFRTALELEQNVQAERPGPTPSGGLAPGRILFAVDHPADQWYGLLTHELTHVFGSDIVPGTGMDAWIAEGLAEYERGPWDPGDLVILRDAVRANAIPLVTQLRETPAGSRSRFVPALGHAAFDFIESRWGKPGVRQFLLALRRAANGGSDPYETAFQIPGNEFSQAFEQYLKARFNGIAAQGLGDRFDRGSTRRIEGSIVTISFPVAAGLACLELWVGTGNEGGQRWGIECGDTPADDLMRMLKPGQQVIVSGAPARQPDTRRLVLRELVRPSDGFTWAGEPR
jgi:beta-lactamase regulating signal transducer with metallopeptidase domain